MTHPLCGGGVDIYFVYIYTHMMGLLGQAIIKTRLARQRYNKRVHSKQTGLLMCACARSLQWSVQIWNCFRIGGPANSCSVLVNQKCASEKSGWVSRPRPQFEYK